MSRVEPFLRKQLVEHAEIADELVQDDANLMELGLDSLDRIEILMFVEEEFDYDFDRDPLMECETFGALVEEFTNQLIAAGKAL